MTRNEGEMTTETEQKQSTALVGDNTQMSIQDSKEYQLIRAYAQQRIPSLTHLPQNGGLEEKKTVSPSPPEDHRRPERKKKRKNKLLKLISCIRPLKEDEVHETKDHKRVPATVSSSDQDDVEDIINKLTKITDSVHFSDEGLETDSDDVVDRIVELLREQGDKLNEEIERNHAFKKELQAALSYGFFKNVIQHFMHRLSPEEIPPTQNKKQARLALTCELTSRLNSMDCHPMNRVLGFGATYLQEYYSAWANKQGGYGEIFRPHNDDDEDDDDEVH